MGYTTQFSGEFKLNKPLNPGFVSTLESWSLNKNVPKPELGYCQWEPTEDLKGLKWDDGEKFYDYVEWLEQIIRLIAPAGYIVSGLVKYQGEEIGDVGDITVANNVVYLNEYKPQILTCPGCGHQFKQENPE